MAISFIALPFMQKEETSKGGHQLVLALIMYDGHVIHLWWKSTRGVVANELHSDLQVSRGDPWERRSNSEFVA